MIDSFGYTKGVRHKSLDASCQVLLENEAFANASSKEDPKKKSHGCWIVL